jgi:hypothetical protein
VETVVDNFTALGSRQDWHAAMLSRIALPDGSGLDARKALACDAQLRREADPRILELELFSPKGNKRASAARGLANGIGDNKSLMRMSVMAYIDKQLDDHCNRLNRRLSEN